MTVRHFLPAAALLVLASAAAPALADVSGAELPRRPGEIARERVEEVLRSLEKFVASLPRYGLPEITAQGDILIPRKNPSPNMPAKKYPESDSANI